MAEINFLPVCSKCKSILKNVEIDYQFESVNGFLSQAHRITPSKCPVCGCMFEQITMPTGLPFIQKGAEA